MSPILALRALAQIVSHGTIMSQAKKQPLTSFQIRAARALVNWSAGELARHSSVSLRTIRRAEIGDRQTSMTAPNDLAIRRAFELAGVEFIDENGDGPGVRLTKRRPKKS
jgi:hypothetical protein